MRTVILLVVFTMVFTRPCPAQTYLLESSVVGAGGGRMTGTSYSVTGTLGQSSPIGVSPGSAYSTHHGFWHAMGGGGAALDAMVLAIELLTPGTARLSWAAVTGATVYDLYRSTSPYFAAGGSPWQTVSAPSAQYDFSDGIGNATLNYFFKGKARNASQQSAESNTVGEFDFDSSGVGVKDIPAGASD